MHVLRMLSTIGVMPGRFYAPDAGAGAGGAPQMTSDAGDDAGDGGDPSGGDGDAGDDTGSRGDTADADDEDLLLGADDDDQHDRRPLEEQLAALRKANRRLKSRYLRTKPIADRLKGQNLDDLVSQARNFEALQQAARSNPKLRALIYGGDADDREPTRTTAKPAALPSLPAEFTAQALGFDPDDSPGNRVIANAIQTLSAVLPRLEALERLAPTVQHLDRTVSSSRAEAEKREWNTALTSVEAEVKKVAPGNKFLMRVTRDAIIGAYQTRGQHRQSPQAIVKQYLADLVAGGQITKQQAGQVSAATQSRMATHNRTLPRSPAGGGQPSGARGTTRPLLKDVHRRLRAGEIGPR